MSDERVLTQKQRRMTLQNLGQFDGGETCSFEQGPFLEYGCSFEEIKQFMIIIITTSQKLL